MVRIRPIQETGLTQSLHVIGWTNAGIADTMTASPIGSLDAPGIVRLFPRDENDQQQPAIAFLHIPKTAGTWFAGFLIQHFRPEEVAPPLFGLARDTNFSDPGKTLFAGHFLYSMVNTPRQMLYMTFLRDPVRRTASQYRSLHNKANFTDEWRATASGEEVDAIEWVQRVSYDEFVRSDNPIILAHIRHVQTAYLSSFWDFDHPAFLSSAIENLGKMFFLGVQEFSDDSLALFRHQTGSSLQWEATQTERNASEHYDVSLSTSGRDRLDELLENDMKVYEAGLRLFKARMAHVATAA